MIFLFLSVKYITMSTLLKRDDFHISYKMRSFTTVSLLVLVLTITRGMMLMMIEMLLLDEF